MMNNNEKQGQVPANTCGRITEILGTPVYPLTIAVGADLLTSETKD